jgi:hypothetical protein
MQAFLARRGLFAASILAISAIAATGHADDAGADSGADDAGVTDAAADVSAPTADASGTEDATTADATTTPDAGSPGSGDEFVVPDAPFNPDGEGPGYIQEDGSLPSYACGNNIFQLVGVTDPGTTFDDAGDSNASVAFDKIPAPYTTPAACLTYGGTDPNDTAHKSVHDCYCNSCFNLMEQCDALEGCKEIMKCELDNSAACTSPTLCYFGPCGTVIDKWNNTSAATFIPYLLQQCGLKAAPACPSN